MAATMTKGTFLSSDGKSEISYKKWIDDAKEPTAVLQLTHGMAEYIERYDEFARFMAENGFVVYGNDHLGHGDSVASPDGYGYFAEKDGYVLLADDVHKLTEIIKTERTGLPVVLLGHSMGSFVARLYLSKYSEDIDAAVVMGTSGKNPAAGAGVFLINLISMFKGERHRSGTINNIAFGAYNKRIAEPKTAFDWLSVETGNVERYVVDERCGFLFTLSGYRDLMKILSAVSEDRAFTSVRGDIPILLIAGGEDPVGNYGAGVKEVFDRFVATGHGKTEIKLVPDKRHEILNEDNKRETYDYILDWCKKALK